MIECTPRGICSSAYLLGGEGHHGEIGFRTFSSRGHLSADGRFYDVVKGSWLSGKWTLEENGRSVIEARRPSSFRRTFELADSSGNCTLEAVSFFGRGMRLSGERTDCRITPVHAFTRRARIEGYFKDFATVAFAFWLTAMVWQEDESASTSTSSAGSF